MAILLIGADWQPMAVISPRRALGLVMADKATPVEGEPTIELRGAKRSISLPTVIRLNYYVSVPQRRARWSKPNVLRRDRYTCQFCGTKMAERDATVDHIVSLAECHRKRIQPNTWGNTCAACRKCQKRKGDRSMEAAGMKFYNPAFEPKIPRVNYLTLVIVNSKHEEWKKYIRA